MAASPYITQLRAHRDEARSFLAGVIKNAEELRRDLTPADNEKLEKATEVYDRYTAEIARHEALDGLMSQSVEAQYAALRPALDASRGLTATGGEFTESRAIRKILADVTRAGGGGSIESYLSDGFKEYRALTTSAGTNVPVSFADFLVMYQRTLNPMFNPAITSFLNASNGAPVVIPRLTTDVGGGGTVTGEGAGITEADATFSAAQLTPFKYATTQIYSSELAEDIATGFNFEQTLAENAARSLGLGLGAHLTTGTGTTQPWGVVTRATNGGTALGTAGGASSWTFFGPPDLATVYMSLPAPVRARATFMVSTDAYTKILAWRDSQNHPILVEGFAGQPSTIFGRPIVENPAMAAVASVSKSVLVGDFSKYYVAHRDPIRVDFSNQYKFGTDQWACRTIERVDGDLVDVKSVAYLVSAAT